MMPTATSAPSHANNANLNRLEPGLLDVAGKLFQVYGFFNYLDLREAQEYNGGLGYSLLQPKWAFSVMLRGFSNGDVLDKSTTERINEQAQGLGIDVLSSYLVCYSSQIFVFKPYTRPVSIMSPRVTKSIEHALVEYAKYHGAIPQIISDYRLAYDLANAIDYKKYRPGVSIDHMNLDALSFIFRRPVRRAGADNAASTDTYFSEENVLARHLAAMASESPVVKFADYHEASKTVGCDLMRLHGQIVSMAKQNGGFVQFTYKNQVFDIPKVPLLNWALGTRGLEKLGVGGTIENWRPLSPPDLKCSDDCQYHSDWWVGAGLPLYVYNLFESGQKGDFSAFNKEVSDFAYELAKRNTLTSFTVLSGSKLPPVRGRVVVYPDSVDDVKDGDILVLPSGGVEFDAYLKSACGNGRGAIILEVGNGAAHLRVVANELGYRVILLPNAARLMQYFNHAFVDTQDIIIKPMQNAALV